MAFALQESTTQSHGPVAHRVAVHNEGGSMARCMKALPRTVGLQHPCVVAKALEDNAQMVLAARRVSAAFAVHHQPEGDPMEASSVAARPAGGHQKAKVGSNSHSCTAHLVREPMAPGVLFLDNVHDSIDLQTIVCRGESAMNLQSCRSGRSSISFTGWLLTPSLLIMLTLISIAWSRVICPSSKLLSAHSSKSYTNLL